MKPFWAVVWHDDQGTEKRKEFPFLDYRTAVRFLEAKARQIQDEHPDRRRGEATAYIIMCVEDSDAS